jgi:hypothetical protein
VTPGTPTKLRRALVYAALAVAVVAAGRVLPDALLATDAQPAYGAWRLGWLREAVDGAGLRTVQAGWPTGGRVVPHIEELLVAPVVAWGGAVVAWNTLQVVRLTVAVAGAWVLLARHGRDPRLAVLAAVPVLEGTAGGMAWLPASLALAAGGGVGRGALAGLLLAQGADVGLAGMLAGLALGVSGRTTWSAWLAVTASAWALEAWGAADPLERALEGTWTFHASRVDRAQLSVAQLHGAGGAALLAAALAALVAVVGPRTELAAPSRDGPSGAGGWLAALGVAAALGPWVLLAPHQPLLVAGRPLPLPGALLTWLPPLAAAPSLTGWMMLAWLGLAWLAARPGAPAAPLRRTLAFGAVLVAASTVRLQAVPDTGAARDPVFDHPGVEDRGPPWDAPGLLAAQQAGKRTATRPGLAPSRLAEHMAVDGWSLRGLQARLHALGVATFRADPSAREGHGAVLAWLLGRSAAVDGAAWPDVRLAAWNPAWSVPLPPRETPPTPPRDDPAWVDPDLAVFVDPSLQARAAVRVRLYRSSDGDRWQAGPVVAHSLSSLGITVTGDGALLVSATAFTNRAVQPHVPHLHASTILGLVSRDGVRWGVRRWMVDVPLTVVDPHLDWDATRGALRLLAWVRTGAFGVDPAALGGDRPVLTAHDGGTPWMEAEPPAFLAAGVADPAWMGARLATTRLVPGERPSVRIWHRDATGWATQATLPDVTVPSPWWDGTRWRLVAQDMRPEGAGQIVEAVEETPGVWSAPRPVDGVPRSPRCESPVATRWQGGYVLLCSERLEP